MATIGIPNWKKLPLGTRVRNHSCQYTGWIDGWADDPRSFEGRRVNPDGTQCRIYVHQGRQLRFAAEEGLEVYADLAEVMDVSTLDERFTVIIGREDYRAAPIFCRIWTLGEFHARPLLRSVRVQFDPHTAQINNLKLEIGIEGWILGDEDSDNDAVGYFYKRLLPILKEGFSMAVVPSHDPQMQSWGLIKVLKKLSEARRFDATGCLVRTRYVDPQRLFKGPERKRLKRHLDSVEVRNDSLIKSKVVLLLDDIVTTGTSLMACKSLLLDAGAAEVICLALGKATQ